MQGGAFTSWSRSFDTKLSLRVVSNLWSDAFVYLGEPLRLGTYSVVKVLSTRLANKDDVESFNKDSR